MMATAEWISIDELHHQVRPAILRFAVVIYPRNVWMVELSSEPRLSQESGVLLIVAGGHLRKLDCYLAPEMKILSDIDLALTASTALAEDLVMRDYLSDQLSELLTG